MRAGYFFFFLAEMKTQWDEDGGRMLLGDNTYGDAVMLRVDQFPVFGFGF